MNIGGGKLEVVCQGWFEGRPSPIVIQSSSLPESLAQNFPRGDNGSLEYFGRNHDRDVIKYIFIRSDLFLVFLW